MEMYLKYIIPNFILISSMLYGWHKLLNKKINFKDPKLYITLMGVMFFSIINYVIVEKFIRIILLTIVLMFFVRYLFNEEIRKCVLTPIFHQLVILFTETIIILFISLIFKENTSAFVQKFFVIFITNVLVATISIIIVNLSSVLKLYDKIISIANKINLTHLISFCLLSFVSLNIFVMNAYYNIEFKYWLIISSILILTFCIIIIYSLKTQSKFNNVSNKYNIAINSLKDYEEMINKYRISNHENKNLLLTIRSMIINDEKDIPNYIDSIISKKLQDDSDLLLKIGIVPSGGLRATIYSGILKIIENKINYDLLIDKKVRTIDLIELDTNTIIDICKILGVYIDNAIDEVKSLKNKNITINIFVEKNTLGVKISNNFKGKINVKQINDIGYTTKGKNHGYGLTLVNLIIQKNSLLKSKTEINSNTFSQTILVKYKKTQ